MNISELTKKHLLLRDKKSRMEKMAKEKIDVVKKEMAQIELKMLAFFNETGQTSAKTDYGTPYKKLTVKFNISNADDFFGYVIDNNAVDLLPKKVNSTVAKSYMDDGVTIPGVKIYSEETINVKRS